MKTHISFLLDETGSMNSIKHDTIGGFNAFLEAQQKEVSGGEADISFSLITFDSNHTTPRYKRADIRDVAPLAPETYNPGASTPLIDAAVKIIRATERAESETKPDRVVVVMQTDGQENASREHTSAELADLVKEKTNAGWEFIFLGAGLDAFAAASSVGININPENVMSYGRERSSEAFGAIADNVANYSTGRTMQASFTMSQRTAAGDEFYKPAKKHRPTTGTVVEQRGSLIDDVEV